MLDVVADPYELAGVLYDRCVRRLASLRFSASAVSQFVVTEIAGSPAISAAPPGDSAAHRAAELAALAAAYRRLRPSNPATWHRAMRTLARLADEEIAASYRQSEIAAAPAGIGEFVARWKGKKPRSQAVKQWAADAGCSERNASKLLAGAGWPGTRGRPAS
jgi:hypothetical protein